MQNNERCLVIPGPFLPYNDTITQIVYKHLRLFPFVYDVCALSNPSDPLFEEELKHDPNYVKFHIHNVDNYDNVLFSIRNVNLFKGLSHMKKYIESAVSMYDGHKYVYTNCWPCYTTRAGVEIKKLNPAVKWIANFSDPINHSPYKFDKETYNAYSLPEKICFNLYIKYYAVDQDEANAFEQADLLIFIDEEQRDFMIQQYMTYFGNIDESKIRKKCVIVPLNYIPEWKKIHPHPVEKSDETYLLSHFGRVYGFRIIEEFIYAFEMFIKRHPKVPVKVCQYGEFRKSDLNLINKLNLRSFFEIHEKVPYQECIEQMNRSDGVLLFDTILPDDQIQPYLPSKILEYSLLKKQVLAVTTTHSPAYRIMKKTDAIACTYNRDEILTGLENLIIRKKPSLIDYAYTNEEAVIPLKKAVASL